MKVNVLIQPREPFRGYLARTQRWACLVVHRRGGKTYACVQDLIARALTYKRPGEPLRYAYVAPTRDQAKDIAWPYFKRFCAEIPQVRINEADLAVTLPNKAMIRLYSGENYERMRGLYFDGVVIDESGDIPPLAWEAVIRPCLADYAGWATFIGTPKGRNAFYRWHQEACTNPEWFSLVLKASESGLIPAEELADLQGGMQEAMRLQEFECDFSIGRPGSIYARFVAEAFAQGRVIDLPYDRSEMVWTTWDLGSPKNTRVIYWQFVGYEIHVIDHDTGLDLQPAERVAHMNAKGYAYGGHFFPHDAAAEEKSGLNFQQQMTRAGLQGIRIVPRCREVWTGINRAAELFSRMVFDKTRCAVLLEALEAYHTKEAKKDGHVTSEPVHDWASHDADAFRQLAEAMQAGMLKGNAEILREIRPLPGSSRGGTKASRGRFGRW